MVLGIDNNEIVKIAVEHNGDIVNGFAMYNTMEDIEHNRLFGCSLMNNESIHPNEAKYYIALFKVPANQDFDMGCYDCNFDDPSYKDCEYKNKEECCLNCWMEYAIDDVDSDMNREDIEFEIRNIISNIVNEDLDKLNQIKIAISNKFDSPVHYQEILNSNYKMHILDELVDNAYNNGLYAGCEPKEFLEPFVDQLALKFDFVDDYPQYHNLNDKDIELCTKLQDNLYDYKLDEALKLLKE